MPRWPASWQPSAAGATLAKEAGRLRELVSQFQLGVSSGQGAAPAAFAAIATNSGHRPVASPARRIVGAVSRAFGSAAPKAEAWETSDGRGFSDSQERRHA